MTIRCGKQGKPSVTDVETSRSNERWMQTCSYQYVLLMLMLILSIALSIVTLTVFLTKNSSLLFVNDARSRNLNDNHHLDNKINPKEPPKNNLTDKVSNLPLISRNVWLAVPPKEPPIPLHLPVPYVIIQHTATDGCSTRGSCSVIVNTIQAFHMDSRGWDDIGYSFLVGGDGNIYEGRGWKNVGAHTYGYNSRSIGIAIIGNFDKVAPSETQIFAIKQLIAEGVEQGFIAKDYKLVAAKQVRPTQSPGLLAYEEIKKWPHWTDHP